MIVLWYKIIYNWISKLLVTNYENRRNIDLKKFKKIRDES